MLILDTHTHIYSDDEASYPPVAKPLRPPGNTGSVTNLERVTKANGVTGVCIVQPSTFYGWDNRFICDTSLQTQRWTAGVCTIDPDDPHSPGLIQHYVKRYGIRALRSVPARDRKIDSPAVVALWRACVESGRDSWRSRSRKICSIEDGDLSSLWLRLAKPMSGGGRAA